MRAGRARIYFGSAAVCKASFDGDFTKPARIALSAAYAYLAVPNASKALGMRTVLIAGNGTDRAAARLAAASKGGDVPDASDPAVDAVLKNCGELKRRLPFLWERRWAAGGAGRLGVPGRRRVAKPLGAARGEEACMSARRPGEHAAVHPSRVWPLVALVWCLLLARFAQAFVWPEAWGMSDDVYITAGAARSFLLQPPGIGANMLASLSKM